MLAESVACPFISMSVMGIMLGLNVEWMDWLGSYKPSNIQPLLY